MTDKIILGFVGKISSGKSTIAKLISQKLDVPILSFGNFLIEYSRNQNLSIDRQSLQDLGNRMISTDPDGFLKNVIERQPFDRVAVIEGIRHKVILDRIRVISPHAIFIYVQAALEKRFEWFNNRSKLSDTKVDLERFMEIDNHPVEVEISKLQSHCDPNFESAVMDSEDLLLKIIKQIDKRTL